MDYKSLSKNLSKVTDSAKDSRKTVMNRVSDAAAQRRAAARKRAILDSVKKRIKDEMEKTETTDEVVEVALNALDEGTEPAAVVQATVEILGGVIDQLEEGSEEPVEDARKRKLVADAKARIAARRRQQAVADAKARIAARRQKTVDSKTRTTEIRRGLKK